MSVLSSYWTSAILVILLRCHFSVCENLHQDPKDPWRGLSMSCTNDDPKNSSISCHGVRIVKRVIQQLLDSATNIEISEGVTLVDSGDGSAAVRRARNLKGTTLGPILGFLEGKELRIKLPSLVPANLENAIKDSLPKGRGSGGGGGFSNKKGGNQGLLILGLMMGKMMAAIGFGGLGMLAMKALMVSSLALMLSLIVAAKKFASSQDSGGGHHVVYAQESSGHHHSKRSANFDDPDLSPYNAYSSIYGISRFS